MQQVASSAFPDHPEELPETVEGFLDVFGEFYTRLKSAATSNDIFDALEMAGAVVQVSEKVFVKKGAAGETFWDHMSKDALKERDDAWTVRFNDEDQWWSGISHILSGNAEPDTKKVNVQKWSKNPVRRITDEERKFIKEHAERTGLGGRQYLAL